MNIQETPTTDLAKFGTRERCMAEDLLKAWREQGLPSDFTDEEVVIMFNMNSGSVFLTNSEYQAAMLTDENKLETWYICPQCGHEGFKADMGHEGNSGCQEYLKYIGFKGDL